MPAEEVTEEVVEEPEIPLDPQTALFRVIQTSLHHEGLARGLHEAVKGRPAHSTRRRCTAIVISAAIHSFPSPLLCVQPWTDARLTCVCWPATARRRRTRS